MPVQTRTVYRWGVGGGYRTLQTFCRGLFYQGAQHCVQDTGGGLGDVGQVAHADVQSPDQGPAHVLVPPDAVRTETGYISS